MPLEYVNIIQKLQFCKIPVGNIMMKILGVMKPSLSCF